MNVYHQKAYKVVDSCKTYGQLYSALRYLLLWRKLIRTTGEMEDYNRIRKHWGIKKTFVRLYAESTAQKSK